VVALRASAEGLLVGVRVSPSAKRTRVTGLYGERLKVQVAAPPEDNRANQELVRKMAEWLGVPRESVCVRSGSTSRDKVLAVRGLDERELGERLQALAVTVGAERGDSGR
jgi:uncharacterized protein (TIGR00251 family)